MNGTSTRAITQTEFEIEKGIPIPAILRGGRPLRKLGLSGAMKKMKIGDSIKVEYTGKAGIHSAYATFSTAARKAGISITSRHLDGNFFRIWRIRN